MRRTSELGAFGKPSRKKALHRAYLQKRSVGATFSAAC
jgi:hypothetical protein